MKFRLRIATLFGVVFLLCIAVPPTRFVGAAEVEICSDVNTHTIFVQQSLKQVEAGADRDLILDTLACIAQSESSDPFIRSAAVRALFHLAPDDPTRQERFMQFLFEPQGNVTARNSAARLLIYVVDANGRKVLRRHVETMWAKGRISPAFEVLTELGDPLFRQWLEKAVAALPADDFRNHYTAKYRRYLGLLENTATLLEALGSNRTDIDRAWLVRQSLRLHIDRKKIREAVLGYLDRVGPSQSGVGHALLIWACDEGGILLSEDGEQIKEIETARNFLDIVSNEGISPVWATLPGAKRAEFYRLKH